MTTNDLRKKFLEFFQNEGHKLFASDTLVPQDPTVMFTSAGMNQFKPYFLGEKKDVARATSCQKCLRTGDLERVGKTAYHHTFFEMLGNFSFGDYFKKEAASFAWKFLTKDLNIKEKDLWVSVYKEDDEAYNIWKDYIGVKESKIVRLGEDSNFWPANALSLGPNGPCGPCSEIFFDKGAKTGCGRDECNPDCDCGRFVEIWNLVFTQFDRVGENKMEPLPQKNIDTGMGLERMAAVLQGKDSNFDIDIFKPAVDMARDILAVNGESPDTRSLINAVVDHARAAAFAICDGVYPSNERRGYVVRKIVRRAVWSASLLGNKKPFLYKFVKMYAEVMGGAYPFDAYSDLKKKENVISQVIRAEEERFIFTLKDGKEQLLFEINKVKDEKKKVLPAESLFRLYDTYGFPLEMSKDVAAGYDIDIDEEGFKELLKKQQDRSRNMSMFDDDIFKGGNIELDRTSTLPVERGEIKTITSIVRLFSLKDNQVDYKDEREVLKEGMKGAVKISETPFYPEGGGQLSDKGTIKTENGEFFVEEVFKVGTGAVIHSGKVVKGSIGNQEKAEARVDIERRHALARAHTATHILQSVLRRLLGEHVLQQGSLVDEDRLRFDFTHFKALSSGQLRDVEAEVNRLILKADDISKESMSLKEAKEKGALAFFEEKYDKEKVRLVSVAEYSKELCGGTHLSNTSEVGSFAIVSESSISSGIRRIEAVVGIKAHELYKQAREALQELSKLLKCKLGDVEETINRIAESSKEDKEALLFLKKKLSEVIADKIVAEAKKVKDVNYIVKLFSEEDCSMAGSYRLNYSDLFILMDIVKEKIGSGFIFFVNQEADTGRFICSVTEDLAGKSFSCKDFLERFKEELYLKGGGRASLAQGVVNKKEENFIKKIEDCIIKFLER